MGFRILLELDTGRKRVQIEDDFAMARYEGRLFRDNFDQRFDKRSLGTPVLQGNGLV